MDLILFFFSVKFHIDESSMCTNTGMAQIVKRLLYAVQRQGSGKPKLFYILCSAHLSLSHTSIRLSIIMGREGSGGGVGLFMFWYPIACDVTSGRNTWRTRLSAAVQRRAEVVVSGKLRKRYCSFRFAIICETPCLSLNGADYCHCEKFYLHVSYPYFSMKVKAKFLGYESAQIKLNWYSLSSR